MGKRILKITGKTLLILAGAWIATLILLEAVLSPAIITGVVNRYADDFINADMTFSKVQVSLFKRFPNLYVNLEDFSITYPADRFDENAGEGQIDTLASFRNFSGSLRIFPLIAGRINIPYLNLEKPRIFAHCHSDGRANWDIFVSGQEEDEESDMTLPAISIGKVNLSNHPHIVYTDARDTLSAILDVKQIGFDGRISTRGIRHCRIGLTVDSLFAAGRYGADTLAFGMKALNIEDDKRSSNLHIEARTMLATRALGRLDIPIELDSRFSFPKDTVFAVDIEDLDAKIATIPVSMNGLLRFASEGLDIKGAAAAVEQCNLNGLLKGLAKNIIPESDKITTDAMLTLLAECDGRYVYQTGALPHLKASVDIPTSHIRHSSFAEDIMLALNAGAETDENGLLHVSLNTGKVQTRGLDVNLSGHVDDLLGEDPAVGIDGSAEASLKDLAQFLPDSLGIHAAGHLSAAIEGRMRMSQMDIYNFSQADLKGSLNADGVKVDIPGEKTSAYFNSAVVTLGPEKMKSRRDTTKSHRLLAVNGQIDSLHIRFGTLQGKGRKIRLTAKTSDEILDEDHGKVSHLGGIFKAGRISLSDEAGFRVALADTDNGFQMVPKKGNSAVPVLSFTSRNKRIVVQSGVQRAMLGDATIAASAAMNSIERRQKVKAYMDSLARRYPDVPRDSLFRYARPAKRGGTMPEWMAEEDFRKQDIDIRLDESLAKYFREWDINGRLDIGKGYVASPYFPLRNRLECFSGTFNNNEVRINEFKVASGKSDISATGRLSGIRRALTRGKGSMLKLDLDIDSDRMDVDELMRAYNAGTLFDIESSREKLSGLSDDEYVNIIAADTSAVSTAAAPSLVVVPGNINAHIRLDARNINYTGLQIDTLKANAVMKERCVQITDTYAKSNVGNISFDGFYATKSKKDIKAGFSLDFEDITAEKVIALMPAIDTLMPPLKSFEGLLNCEIAGTAQLDTNMNIVMPSIDGILRITGDNLAIKNNAAFRKLARKLLFKNKKEGHIEHMSVEGIISNNVVEVFPFVLKMDRYTLALSGIQNLDMSFRYHVSLIKSPFLIRLGVDMYGPDFDNMKFKIGRAKYRNPNVPVFSKVIDNTKINLVRSIENIFVKGVDATLKENRGHSLLKNFIKNIKYSRAVDQEMEPLSAEEQKKVEEEEAAQAAEEAREMENVPTAEDGQVTVEQQKTL